MEDVVIIGGGPAGMTAGIYAARKNLKTIVLENDFAGGQMASAITIENYPGFPEPITGMELSRRMETQARKAGVKFEFMSAVRIEKKDGHFRVKTEKNSHDCKAIIIATGARHRELQVPGEKELSGKGVAYCVTCDAPLYRGKAVGVVGGGNIAATAAIYLNDLAGKVYLFHRRDEMRADEVLTERLKKTKVNVMWDTIVKEIKGTKRVEAVVLENVDTKKETTLPLDGLFIAIGETPTAKLAEELGVKTDARGFVVVDTGMRTNVPGVFAAGDITGKVLQITTAVGEGTAAALSAYDYIKSLKEDRTK